MTNLCLLTYNINSDVVVGAQVEHSQIFGGSRQFHERIIRRQVREVQRAHLPQFLANRQDQFRSKDTAEAETASGAACGYSLYEKSQIAKRGLHCIGIPRYL